MKFIDDFNRFWGMINSGENFSFARYADGEVLLMQKKEIGINTQAFNVDKWSAFNGNTKVGIDLIKTLNHTELNYFYAISAKNDSIHDHNFLLSAIKQDISRITYVNLWINGNYHKMKNNLQELKRDVILICNSNAKRENYPFNVTSIIPFPDDCVNFWETNGDEYINYLTCKINSVKNQLFFISCGPVSEIIIHELYIKNPNNSYIDVGSSIDEYTHGYKTRPYMHEGTVFSKLISEF